MLHGVILSSTQTVASVKPCRGVITSVARKSAKLWAECVDRKGQALEVYTAFW